MFIVLIGLGTWQLERKAWKEGLIAALAARTSAEPSPLPSPERWSALDPQNDEFRRVTFPATIASEREVLVYGSGSSVRPDVSGPGYWVFAPAALAGGAVVVVNRGFLQEGQQDPKTHMPPAGSVDLIGALRWPEPRGWFVPNDDPARNLWFARDQLAMARAKGWGQRGAVLCRAGELDRTAAARRAAHADAAQRAPAICAHLVRPRRRARGHVRVLVSKPAP
jgi:cytochrome oxidase assembly protein ShyY1